MEGKKSSPLSKDLANILSRMKSDLEPPYKKYRSRSEENFYSFNALDSDSEDEYSSVETPADSADQYISYLRKENFEPISIATNDNNSKVAPPDGNAYTVRNIKQEIQHLNGSSSNNATVNKEKHSVHSILQDFKLRQDSNCLVRSINQKRVFSLDDYDVSDFYMDDCVGQAGDNEGGLFPISRYSRVYNLTDQHSDNISDILNRTLETITEEGEDDYMDVNVYDSIVVDSSYKSNQAEPRSDCNSLVTSSRASSSNTEEAHNSGLGDPIVNSRSGLHSNQGSLLVTPTNSKFNFQWDNQLHSGYAESEVLSEDDASTISESHDFPTSHDQYRFPGNNAVHRNNKIATELGQACKTALPLNEDFNKKSSSVVSKHSTSSSSTVKSSGSDTTPKESCDCYNGAKQKLDKLDTNTSDINDTICDTIYNKQQLDRLDTNSSISNERKSNRIPSKKINDRISHFNKVDRMNSEEREKERMWYEDDNDDFTDHRSNSEEENYFSAKSSLDIPDKNSDSINSKTQDCDSLHSTSTDTLRGGSSGIPTLRVDSTFMFSQKDRPVDWENADLNSEIAESEILSDFISDTESAYSRTGSVVSDYPDAIDAINAHLKEISGTMKNKSGSRQQSGTLTNVSGRSKSEETNTISGSTLDQALTQNEANVLSDTSEIKAKNVENLHDIVPAKSRKEYSSNSYEHFNPVYSPSNSQISDRSLLIKDNVSLTSSHLNSHIANSQIEAGSSQNRQQRSNLSHSSLAQSQTESVYSHSNSEISPRMMSEEGLPLPPDYLLTMTSPENSLTDLSTLPRINVSSPQSIISTARSNNNRQNTTQMTSTQIHPMATSEKQPENKPELDQNFQVPETLINPDEFSQPREDSSNLAGDISLHQAQNKYKLSFKDEGPVKASTPKLNPTDFTFSVDQKEVEIVKIQHKRLYGSYQNGSDVIKDYDLTNITSQKMSPRSQSPRSPISVVTKPVVSNDKLYGKVAKIYTRSEKEDRTGLKFPRYDRPSVEISHTPVTMSKSGDNIHSEPMEMSDSPTGTPSRTMSLFGNDASKPRNEYSKQTAHETVHFPLEQRTYPADNYTHKQTAEILLPGVPGTKPTPGQLRNSLDTQNEATKPMSYKEFTATLPENRRNGHENPVWTPIDNGNSPVNSKTSEAKNNHEPHSYHRKIATHRNNYFTSTGERGYARIESLEKEDQIMKNELQGQNSNHNRTPEVDKRNDSSQTEHKHGDNGKSSNYSSFVGGNNPYTQSNLDIYVPKIDSGYINSSSNNKQLDKPGFTPQQSNNTCDPSSVHVHNQYGYVPSSKETSHYIEQTMVNGNARNVNSTFSNSSHNRLNAGNYNGNYINMPNEISNSYSRNSNTFLTSSGSKFANPIDSRQNDYEMSQKKPSDYNSYNSKDYELSENNKSGFNRYDSNQQYDSREYEKVNMLYQNDIGTVQHDYSAHSHGTSDYMEPVSIYNPRVNSKQQNLVNNSMPNLPTKTTAVIPQKPDVTTNIIEQGRLEDENMQLMRCMHNYENVYTEPYVQKLQTCTAIATSTALARKDFKVSPNDNDNKIGDAIVSAVASAEATGESPYVAVARATARAATIATASAAKGATQQDDSRDITVMISTSCTIKDNGDNEIENNSKDVIKALQSDAKVAVYTRIAPNPNAIVNQYSSESREDRLLKVSIEQGQDNTGKHSIEISLPAAADNLPQLINDSINKILQNTNCMGETHPLKQSAGVYADEHGGNGNNADSNSNDNRNVIGANVIEHAQRPVNNNKANTEEGFVRSSVKENGSFKATGRRSDRSIGSWGGVSVTSQARQGVNLTQNNSPHKYDEGSSNNNTMDLKSQQKKEFNVDNYYVKGRNGSVNKGDAFKINDNSQVARGPSKTNLELRHENQTSVNINGNNAIKMHQTVDSTNMDIQHKTHLKLRQDNKASMDINRTDLNVDSSHEVVMRGFEEGCNNGRYNVRSAVIETDQLHSTNNYQSSDKGNTNQSIITQKSQHDSSRQVRDVNKVSCDRDSNSYYDEKDINKSMLNNNSVKVDDSQSVLETYALSDSRMHIVQARQRFFNDYNNSNGLNNIENRDIKTTEPLQQEIIEEENVDKKDKSKKSKKKKKNHKKDLLSEEEKSSDKKKKKNKSLSKKSKVEVEPINEQTYNIGNNNTEHEQCNERQSLNHKEDSMCNTNMWTRHKSPNNLSHYKGSSVNKDYDDLCAIKEDNSRNNNRMSCSSNDGGDIGNAVYRAQSVGTLPKQFFNQGGSRTSLIETDLDTGISTQRPLVYETDLDFLQRSNRSKSVGNIHKTTTMKAKVDKKSTDSFERTQSMTYLSKVKQQNEPLSEHEQRVNRSLSKLSLPSWFNNVNPQKHDLHLENTHNRDITKVEPAYRVSPSHTDGVPAMIVKTKPVVIQHRVNTPAMIASSRHTTMPMTSQYAMTSQMKGDKDNDFKLPSSRWKKESHSFKPIPIKALHDVSFTNSEEVQRPAKEAYLRLKAEQERKSNSAVNNSDYSNHVNYQGRDVPQHSYVNNQYTGSYNYHSNQPFIETNQISTDPNMATTHTYVNIDSSYEDAPPPLPPRRQSSDYSGVNLKLSPMHHGAKSETSSSPDVLFDSAYDSLSKGQTDESYTSNTSNQLNTSPSKQTEEISSGWQTSNKPDNWFNKGRDDGFNNNQVHGFNESNTQPQGYLLSAREDNKDIMVTQKSQLMNNINAQNMEPGKRPSYIDIVEPLVEKAKASPNWRVAQFANDLENDLIEYQNSPGSRRGFSGAGLSPVNAGTSLNGSLGNNSGKPLVNGSAQVFNGGKHFNNLETRQSYTNSLSPSSPQDITDKDSSVDISKGNTTFEDMLDGLLGIPSLNSSMLDTSRASMRNHLTDISPSTIKPETPLESVYRLLRSAQSTQEDITRDSDQSFLNLSQGANNPKFPQIYDSSVDTLDSSNNFDGTSFSVKCRNPKCKKEVGLEEAKLTYKTCHNCFTYYCSRECRKAHWERHKKKCIFSRVNSYCKHVIKKIHGDPVINEEVSKAARTGYIQKGRGSVIISFSSLDKAEKFLNDGLPVLENPIAFISVSEIQESQLFGEQTFELLDLCRTYNPEIKYILDVVILGCDQAPVKKSLPSPRHHGPAITKCAKLRLAGVTKKSAKTSSSNSLMAANTKLNNNNNTLKSRISDNDTLILTAVPGSDFTENMEERKAREICFTNIQSKLRDRGISLRHQFPDVYKKLCLYVSDKVEFAPITLFPTDKNTGRPFMCLIMPNSEPDIEWKKNPGLMKELGFQTEV